MRKRDSMRRDEALADWHTSHGFGCPATGITQAFIEYDRGAPVGLISYHREGAALPRGREEMASHRAMANLKGPMGDALPFISVIYDPETWTYRLMAHNDTARAMTGKLWAHVTEEGFASVLYAMRGRALPDLSRYGVTWSAPDPIYVTLEEFPGQLMSVRRRNFEPEMQVRPNLRIPCVDIDMMVTDQDEDASLLVEYKRAGARVDMKSSSLIAASQLTGKSGAWVPAVLAEYEFDGVGGMSVAVTPLNAPGRRHLSYVLCATGVAGWTAAEAICGDAPVRLTEFQWLNVLRAASDL